MAKRRNKLTASYPQSRMWHPTALVSHCSADVGALPGPACGGMHAAPRGRSVCCQQQPIQGPALLGQDKHHNEPDAPCKAHSLLEQLLRQQQQQCQPAPAYAPKGC